MTMAKVAAFMRQPSTVLGVSTLVGTLTAVLTAQITWQNAVPAVAGALAAVALPDNPRAQVAIKDATAAVVTAEQTMTNSAKETAVSGVGRTALMVALLLVGSFVLSAHAGNLPGQVRAVARLQNISALAARVDVPIQVMRTIVSDQATGVAQ